MKTDRLAQARTRKVEIDKLTRGARSGLLDIKDIEIELGRGLKETEVREQVSEPLTKLKQAREYIENLPEELGQLTKDLEEELLQIGYKLQEARSFTGWEWFLLKLGMKDKAERSRLERLKYQTITETIVQLEKLFEKTIEELDEIGRAIDSAMMDYDAMIKNELAVFAEYEPKYSQAKAKREELEAAVEMLQRELDAGTVSLAERPAKEQERDDLKRDFHKMQLLENDFMIRIKIAQDSVKDLQKTRDAAAETVKSIHGMQRQLEEKLKAYTPLFEHGMAWVQAQAKIERFTAIDPAMNKLITDLTELGVIVASGATETFTDRLSKSAITPEKQQELLDALANLVTKFRDDLHAIAEEVEKNPAQTPNEPAGIS